MTKFIWFDFGKSEFLKILAFNWSKSLYLECSSKFRHLDFLRAVQMTLNNF